MAAFTANAASLAPAISPAADEIRHCNGCPGSRPPPFHAQGGLMSLDETTGGYDGSINVFQVS